MNKDRQVKMEAKLKEIISTKLFSLTMEIQSEFGLITVNNLTLAPDMSYIDIFVSSLKSPETLCKTLAVYAQELKEEINKNITLRKTPIIRFRYDDSMEHATNIISQINALPLE